MDIGKRIKQRRKELHMSVDDIAKQLGKNRATIYRYEKGDIEHLPMDILEPLAAALKTTPQYLLGWVTEETKKSGTEVLTKKAKGWYAEFGHGFTDDEYQKLVEYARFLISQRDNK